MFKKILTKNRWISKVMNVFNLHPTGSQQMLDWHEGYVLAKCSKLLVAAGPTKPAMEVLTTDVVEKIHLEADELESLGKLGSQVQDELDEQVTRIFQNIHDLYGNSNDTDIGVPDYAKVAKNKKCLYDLIGFELRVQPSSIPGASDGLFIARGQISPGTVIAIYPGTVHLLEYTSKPDYLANLLPDENMMMIGRFDGILIDGRTADKMPANPIALAHKVNHCPIGHGPNVLQLPYSFPHDPLNKSKFFPHHLRPYIPNSYGAQPTILGTVDRSAFMHTVVLMACRKIGPGEELFMDYRMSPHAPNRPSWYHDVDIETLNRIWDLKLPVPSEEAQSTSDPAVIQDQR